MSSEQLHGGVRQWFRDNQRVLMLMGAYVLAVGSAWPYIATYRVGPTQFILGLWPWLFAHPVRLLGVLPFTLYGLLLFTRAPRM